MVKRWLKSVLRKAGYDLVRYVEMPVQPFEVLPYVVVEQLEKDPTFLFLQIGVHDGMGADPVHELVRKHRLPGLLVEPLPDRFERLKASYADVLHVAFERCAIAWKDGEASIYRVRADAPVPRWVHGLASPNRGHLSEAESGFPGLEKYVEEVRVRCLTLSTLLDKHGMQHPTLLQIDASGFGCEIVRMALAAGLRPAIINYEFIHAVPRDRVECKKRLGEAGYRFIDIGVDTLAVRRSP